MKSKQLVVTNVNFTSLTQLHSDLNIQLSTVKKVFKLARFYAVLSNRTISGKVLLLLGFFCWNSNLIV